MRTLPVAFLLAALAVLAAPAQAHTAIFSSDGAIRGSIGLLGEPVTTYQKTGLDACFTENTTATPRPAVAVNPGNFTATLKAPDGRTFTRALAGQFGRAGCLQFDQPLVLTLAGQYLVDISGNVNGSVFAATNVPAGGPVLDEGNLTFPDTGAQTEAQLRATIAALQSRLSGVETRLAAVESASTEDGGDGGRFAPAAPLGVLLLAVALALVTRRR